MIVEQILSDILVAVASYCKRKTAQKMPARVAADRGVKQKYSSYVLMTFSGLFHSPGRGCTGMTCESFISPITMTLCKLPMHGIRPSVFSMKS